MILKGLAEIAGTAEPAGMADIRDGFIGVQKPFGSNVQAVFIEIIDR